MGEIDTKPIEPVQVALSLFGENGDQRNRHYNGSHWENEKEKIFEGLLKDLANYKLQLEAKDSAYNQALLKLEHHRKTADELSNLLKDSEVEKDKFIEECREARVRIDELESNKKEMADQLSETVKIREQLSHIFNELNDTQGELLRMETELASARDLQLKAMTQAELMEASANMDREKMEGLLKHVAELNDAILMSKQAAIEAERDTCTILSEKDAEIELMTATVVQAQEQLEAMRKELEVVQNLENQLMDKSILIDTLHLQLKQANELLNSSEKATSDALNDLQQLKEDAEVMDRKNSDQTFYIEALEMEVNQLKLNLKNENEEVSHLNSNIEMLTGELENVKTEMEEVKERETEAQVEIAVLKSELHKGRSKIAAAEAAEARVQNAKSGLYLAVQHLAVEAEEAKKENQRSKEGTNKVAEETEIPTLVNPRVVNSSQDVEVSQNDESKEEAEERSVNDARIMISLEEYESLITKAKKADQIPKPVAETSDKSETMSESESLKKELEIAMAKIAEFRTRAEQAVTRANFAEKAKLALEDQLRKWREQKQKRKAALAALREESFPKSYIPPAYESEITPATYQPLGKVLNMKF